MGQKEILHTYDSGYSGEGLRTPGNNCQRLLASSVAILQVLFYFLWVVFFVVLFLFVLSAAYFVMHLKK